MRTGFIIGLLATAAMWTGCNKDDDEKVSTLETVSRPTINFTTPPYLSINVGGNIPDVTATAYDSTLQESYTVTISGQENVDNTTPGLYVITAKSTNRLGFYSEENIYVAVTDAADLDDLSGEYVRTANNEPVNVTRLARALYMTDDVGGAPTLEVPALFVRLTDSTFDVPPQPTSAGTLSCSNEQLIRTPTDTSFSYSVINSSFGTAVRTFEKQ